MHYIMQTGTHKGKDVTKLTEAQLATYAFMKWVYKGTPRASDKEAAQQYMAMREMLDAHSAIVEKAEAKTLAVVEEPKRIPLRFIASTELFKIGYRDTRMGFDINERANCVDLLECDLNIDTVGAIKILANQLGGNNSDVISFCVWKLVNEWKLLSDGDT